MGATLGVEERTAVAGDEAVHRLHPLRRPFEVEVAGADQHRHAAGVRRRQRITALAGQRRRHRLVQQRHPLIGTALLHQRGTDRGHRQQFEIDVAARPADLQRLAGQAFALDRVVGHEGRRAQQPAPKLGASASTIRAARASHPRATATSPTNCLW
ncbi:MAG TPA: hypothetical protein VFJ85_06550 [Acidimicrobiales bacterium]|nr:hypothetical protein [Acidimicrobiales bacterium]